MSIEFTPRSCQYINEQGLFCDVETKLNVSWCDKHHAVVFATTNVKDDDLEKVEEEFDTVDELEIFDGLDDIVVEDDEKENEEETDDN